MLFVYQVIKMSSASVSCIICKEVLISDVASGPCGHMYHNKCIKQWIQKSTTCPQCRGKITLSKVLKLFPTYSDESIDDVNDLQVQLEQMTRKLKETEEKYETVSSKLVKTQASLEKTQEAMYENTIRDMRVEACLVAVTEQAKLLREENKKMKRVQKENNTLGERLTMLHGLQVILDGTQEEVEEMTKTYTDIKTIATFATALKRALSETEKEKTQLVARLKLLHLELQSEKNKSHGLTQSLSANCEPDHESSQNSHTLVKKLSPQKRNPKTKASIERHIDMTGEFLKKRKVIQFSSESDSDSDDSDSLNGGLKQMAPKRVVTQATKNANSPYLQVKQGWLGTIMNKNKKLAPKLKQKR